MENALLTDRTALDVDPGDAQHEVGHGLRRGRRQRWLRQQDATLGENGGAAAIGEQAEVANADEAVGDDVEQEATEKLVDVERHDLHAIGVSVVAPPKTDAAVREAEEAVVGEGHAVRVASTCAGPAKGGLRYTEPGLRAQSGEPKGKGGRLGEGREAAGAV